MFVMTDVILLFRPGFSYGFLPEIFHVFLELAYHIPGW